MCLFRYKNKPLTSLLFYYMDCLAPVTASEATEALRLFLVFNETAQRGCEIEASSHEDAVKRFRQLLGVEGYACIQTSDTGVFFGNVEGPLHKRHFCYGPEGAPQRGADWVPHFAPLPLFTPYSFDSAVLVC